MLKRRGCPWFVALLSIAVVSTAHAQDPNGTDPARKPERPGPPAAVRSTQKAPPPFPLSQERLVPQHLAGQRDRIAHYTVFPLAAPDGVDKPFEVQVPIDGSVRTLKLEKYSVRSSIFEVLAHREDGSYESLPTGQIRTFRGGILEDKDASVAGSLLRSGLEAMVRFGDGRRYRIEPHLEAAERGIFDEYIVYDTRDIVSDDDGTCGVVNDSRDGPPTGAPEAGGCGASLCLAELAYDCDFGFYEKFASNTTLVQDIVEMLTNVVNVQYERDVQIRHVITTIIIRTSLATEPTGYATATTLGCDNEGLLDFMQDWWNANHQSVPRDVAALLTGRVIPGSGIGCAYTSAVCDLSRAYSVSEVGGYVGVECPLNLVAHELGHNWGANHCDCSGSGGEPPYTMNASQTPCPLRFHPTETVPDINTYVAGQSCLDAGVPNDNAHDAPPICSSISSGSTALATNDGSASCGSSNASPDVWWRYTPSFDGTLTVSTCAAPTDFDTVLSVHDANLDEIGCNDDFCGLQSELSVPVEAGQTYFIRVSGYNGASGFYQLDTSGPGCATPINDNWDQPLEICPGTYYGATTGASNDGTATCAVSSSTRDVWFLYRSRRSDMMVVDTCGSLYDTSIAVYDANHPTPNLAAALIDCNDDWCGLQSRIDLPTTDGGAYLIRVSGYNGDHGSFQLNLTGPGCENERCADATPIDGEPMYGHFGGVYQIDGDSSCGAVIEPPDLWYRYTASASGTLVVSTCGTHGLYGVDSGTDTVVSLHSGCPGDTSNQLACNDDDFTFCSQEGLSRDSLVSANVLAGQTVRIRVKRFSVSAARKTFILDADLRPGNDSCSDATPVGVGSFIDSFLDATNDGDATCGSSASSADVWYSFTALEAGELQVTTCGTHDLGGVDSGMDTVLSLHSACPGTSSNQLDCNDDSPSCSGIDQGTVRDSAVTADVTAGQTVLIRASHFGPSEPGNFQLNVALTPAGGGGNYCGPGVPFSTGASSVITANSLAISITQNDLVLSANNLPAFMPGIFIAGPTQASIPFFNGSLCIDPVGLQRLEPVQVPTNGNVVLPIDIHTQALSFGGGAGAPINVTPGLTHNFQRWNRDTSAPPTFANFSDAVNVLFTP